MTATADDDPVFNLQDDEQWGRVAGHLQAHRRRGIGRDDLHTAVARLAQERPADVSVGPDVVVVLRLPAGGEGVAG